MGISRDKEGTDRRNKRPNLLLGIKEASLKGSWQEVLSAMEEAKSRDMRLNGRCSDLGAWGLGEGWARGRGKEFLFKLRYHFLSFSGVQSSG